MVWIVQSNALKKMAKKAAEADDLIKGLHKEVEFSDM